MTKLQTFDDLRAAVEAEFSGAPEYVIRDLLALRASQERAINASDFREVTKTQRLIMRKEAWIRSVLTKQREEEGQARGSLRDRLVVRYSERAP